MSMLGLLRFLSLTNRAPDNAMFLWIGELLPGVIASSPVAHVPMNFLLLHGFTLTF